MKQSKISSTIRLLLIIDNFQVHSETKSTRNFIRTPTRLHNKAFFHSKKNTTILGWRSYTSLSDSVHIKYMYYFTYYNGYCFIEVRTSLDIFSFHLYYNIHSDSDIRLKQL